MWYRVIPIIIIGLIALLVLAMVLYQIRRGKDLERKERLRARERWAGTCYFDNPNTGAKCEREEFHLENHYHDVNGTLVYWP